jgi:hypothetical protein
VLSLRWIIIAPLCTWFGERKSQAHIRTGLPDLSHIGIFIPENIRNLFCCLSNNLKTPDRGINSFLVVLEILERHFADETVIDLREKQVTK